MAKEKKVKEGNKTIKVFLIICLVIIVTFVFGVAFIISLKNRYIKSEEVSEAESPGEYIPWEELIFIEKEEDLANLPEDVDWSRVVFLGGIPDISDDEMAEYEAQQQSERESTASDIEGWSQQDKLDAGLMLYGDGSDNDNDGLTDKEEIEIYKSDPLNPSTAGDLYTDGYKVENGMDVHTAYEYEGDYIFPNKEGCDEVTLIPETVSDLNVYFWDSTGYCERENQLGFYEYTWLDEYTYYKDYSCNGFGGTIWIDIGDILSDNNLAMSDITVLTTRNRIYDYDLSEVDFSAEGNKIELKNDNYFSGSQIIVANRHKGEKSADTIDGAAIRSDEIAEMLETVNGIVTVPGSTRVLMVGSQAGATFALPGMKSRLYYTTCGDEDIDRISLERAIKDMGPIDGYCRSIFHWNDLVLEDAELVTNEEFDYLYQRFKEEMPDYEVNPLDAYGEKYWFHEIFYKWDGSENPEGAELTRNEQVIASSSDDFFPFTNFGSYISPGGNCSGFAVITALVHNRGSITPADSYLGGQAYKGVLNYDVSQSSSNATLLDPGLSDCRDINWSSFVEKNASENTSGVSNVEANLIDCIGLYWAKSNDIIRVYRNAMKCQSCVFSQDEEEALKADYTQIANHGYDISMFYDIMGILDEGKFLNLAMSYRPGRTEPLSGHAINIIGYDVQKNEITNEIRELTLYVYDSNYGCPNKIFASGEKNIRYNNKISIHPDGGNGFWYSYKPTDMIRYCNDSWWAVYGLDYYFIVYDDEYNILSRKQ